MNTTKIEHTAGPWESRIERDGRTSIHYIKIGTSNAYTQRGVGMTEDEVRANCNLIAAAPDLLKACKAFEGYYDGAPDSSTRGMAHAYAIVRAAIQKATL